jgi:class 3 adenylate cyclase
MQQIAYWLNTLGLGQYAQRFAENDIDPSVLCDLTDHDLEKIGVSLGHRRKILRAIAELDEVGLRPARGPRTTAERRQLTVMFADLVGSTALSTRLDPEDLREIIGAYHRCCAEQIEKSGGFVARYMGDGVLAYFGYPRAHEDDAERAVRAGLAVVDVISRLMPPTKVRLEVRVGIATGLVVVGETLGEGSSQEQVVIGETPNLAAVSRPLLSRIPLSLPTERDSCSAGDSILRILGRAFSREWPMQFRRGGSLANTRPKVASRPGKLSLRAVFLAANARSTF